MAARGYTRMDGRENGAGYRGRPFHSEAGRDSAEQPGAQDLHLSRRRQRRGDRAPPRSRPHHPRYPHAAAQWHVGVEKAAAGQRDHGHPHHRQLRAHAHPEHRAVEKDGCERIRPQERGHRGTGGEGALLSRGLSL